MQRRELNLRSLNKAPYKFVCCTIIALMSTLPLFASVDTVSISTDPSPSVGMNSLRDLIVNGTADTIVFDAALNGDTIRISQSNSIEISRSVVIIGNDTTNTVISGENNANLFEITGGSAIVINDLTMTNGNATVGGAIYNEGYSLSMDRVNINNNVSGDSGGGIYQEDGDLTITNSTFANNSAQGGSGGGAVFYEGSSNMTLTNILFRNNTANSTFLGGGAIMAESSSSTTTIDDCIFSDNSATLSQGGGAIYNNGMITISNTTINNNSTTGPAPFGFTFGGGGVYNNAGGELLIENSQINNNTADSIAHGGGGGISNLGRLTIHNTTISSNSTSNRGGGINNQGILLLERSYVQLNRAEGGGGGIEINGIVTAILSTISGNSSQAKGGGFSSDGTLNCFNCAISGNNANTIGGGIYSTDASSLTLMNSTIAGNNAMEGGGILTDGGPITIKSTIIAKNTATSSGPDFFTTSLISGTVTNRGNNLIQDTSGARLTITSTDTIGIDPNFVMDVPGPAPSTGGDLRLLAWSPAVDRGMFVQDTTLAVDLAMTPRVSGVSADIGAFEYRGPTPFAFTDPCDCLDPQNYTEGGTYYFHDVLTYINPAADSVLLDSVLTTDFYSTAGTVYGDSIAFTEVNDSTFTIDFWRADGVAPTVHIYVRNGPLTTPAMLSSSSFGAVCRLSDCTREEIPTLSEWGAIILLLSMMIVGVNTIRYARNTLTT